VEPAGSRQDSIYTKKLVCVNVSCMLCGCEKFNHVANVRSSMMPIRLHCTVNTLCTPLHVPLTPACGLPRLLLLLLLQAFPLSVLGIILRGVCLMRPQEIHWMFGGGAGALVLADAASCT
jgi:hypothetical protein